MAETYRLQRDYQTAFDYYDQAIAYNRDREYYAGAAVFYTNYGVAAWQNGQKEEARRLFQYAADVYSASHEYSAYPIALSYLALYDAEEEAYRRAADKLCLALKLSETIGSDWWMGVSLYITWKIRKLLDRRRTSCDALNALWPESEVEHCLLALSFLRRLQPRIETEEMERELLRLTETRG